MAGLYVFYRSFGSVEMVHLEKSFKDEHKEEGKEEKQQKKGSPPVVPSMHGQVFGVTPNEESDKAQGEDSCENPVTCSDVFHGLALQK